MILVAHIIIALSTILYTTYLYLDPAQNKFKPAYWLLGMTIASGTTLVVFDGASILRACLSGLLYIGVVSAAIAAAKNKLAREERDI